MTSELFTLYCYNSGSQGSGEFQLASEIIANVSGLQVTVPEVFRLPKGTKFKIWETKLFVTPINAIGASGQDLTVVMNVSEDCGSTWTIRGADYFSATPTRDAVGPSVYTNDRESRPSHVIESADGKKAIVFGYTHHGAGAATLSGVNVYMEQTCEIVDID